MQFASFSFTTVKHEILVVLRNCNKFIADTQKGKQCSA